MDDAAKGTARPSRRWWRRLSVILMLAVFTFLGYSCGLFTPPGPLQQLQTRSQEHRYDAYPKPAGMERLGVERYTLIHDSFGPRDGQVRYLYSVPEGWAGRELIAWLRNAAPTGLVVVDDAACAELVASRPGPPPTPTSGDSDGLADPVSGASQTNGSVTSDNALGDVRVLLEQETSLTLVRSIDHLGDGLTFRLRPRNREVQAAGVEAAPIGVDPDEDLVVVADHPSFACGPSQSPG